MLYVGSLKACLIQITISKRDTLQVCVSEQAVAQYRTVELHFHRLRRGEVAASHVCVAKVKIVELHER